jgi:hypothetical protein
MLPGPAAMAYSPMYLSYIPTTTASVVLIPSHPAGVFGDFAAFAAVPGRTTSDRNRNCGPERPATGTGSSAAAIFFMGRVSAGRS